MLRVVSLAVVLLLPFGSQTAFGFELNPSYADQNVCRIDVTTAAGVTQGTATLLCVDPTKDIAYFATCYHVMHNAQSIEVKRYDQRVLGFQTVLTQADCTFEARPHWDLVIFSSKFVPLQAPVGTVGVLGSQACDLAWLAKNATKLYYDWHAAMLAAKQAATFPPAKGYAYGYPGFDRDVSFFRRRRPLGPRAGKARLGDFLEIGQVFDPNQVNANDPLFVGYLNNEITLPGMSGGVVAIGRPAKIRRDPFSGGCRTRKVWPCLQKRSCWPSNSSRARPSSRQCSRLRPPLSKRWPNTIPCRSTCPR